MRMLQIDHPGEGLECARGTRMRRGAMTGHSEEGRGRPDSDFAAGCSCRGGETLEPEPTLEIVGQRMPEDDGARLGAAADEEASQAVLPHPGVDALGQGAPPIDRLAGLARHALAPGRNPGTGLAPRPA